jgi:hypothetical protein
MSNCQQHTHVKTKHEILIVTFLLGNEYYSDDNISPF